MLRSVAIGRFGQYNFIQVSSYTTQNKIDNLTFKYNELMDLAGGTSSLYTKAGDLPILGGVLNLIVNGVKVSDTPAAADHAVNKNYSDSHMSGRCVLVSGSGVGQSLKWNDAAWTIDYPNISQLRGVALAQQFPTSCTAAQTMTNQSPTDTFACSTITISSSQVSGLGVSVALNAGSTVGTVAAGNDSRIVNAVQTFSSAGGNVSGSFSSLSVNRLRGVAVSANAPINDQVLKYNSGNSQFEYAAAVDTGTGTNQVVQLDSNAKLPAVDGSQLTNLPTVPFMNVVSVATGTWTLPAGVTRLFVQVWGGGAAGGTGAAGRILVWY